MIADTDNDGISNDLDLDQDNDGMSNEFEDIFKLDNCDPDDAEFDYDNDGFSNLHEYLGDDNIAGNSDWSDPTDPNDTPDLPPYVTFSVSKIKLEENEQLVINSSILNVVDSERDFAIGLIYEWDWGDQLTDSIKVTQPENHEVMHTYSTPGTYLLQLTVTDPQNNSGTDSLNVKVNVKLPEVNKIDGSENGTISTSDEELMGHSYDYWGLILMIATFVIIIVIIILVVYYTKPNEPRY